MFAPQLGVPGSGQLSRRPPAHSHHRGDNHTGEPSGDLLHWPARPRLGVGASIRAAFDDLVVSVWLPLQATFTTPTYLLARGDRTQMEAGLGPSGRNATATTQEPIRCPHRWRPEK
jgi:hypothetical protein